MDKKDPESHFQEETLVMTTHNLFFGGTETTSTTLRYGLLILLKYPEVAAKVRAELDAVVGRMCTPRLEDREHLPYTNAVLHEIQRCISVLPRALTHDAHLRGYFPPKGTFVIPLLVSSHRDPTRFKDPDCFNPTKFLDDKGKFQSNDAFMPFAPGKRVCLDAGLARSEIFLFFTAILQRFCLLPVGSPTNIDLTLQCTGLGNIPPSLPAPPGGPLWSGSAALCSPAPGPPFPLWSIKAPNCRWTGLLTNKRERENQTFAALR
ncbi:hypothetical protein GH733_012440 [Mirounga leonina]|nr:hypothetical protein GH733_012440 [Mirounga leonina]